MAGEAAGRGHRMSVCRRASSCCTGSAAPTAPGTASWHGLTRNATCRWLSTSRGTARRADAERPITFAGCVAHVLAAGPERFVLCGYSLGGRIALHVALAAPERVSRLVLVSTTAGIEDAAERGRTPPLRPPARRRARIEPFRGFHRALAHPAAVRRRTPRGRPCSHAKISAATVPMRSPRRFEASAPGRWSPSGTGSRSCRCRSSCSSALATRSSRRSAQRMTELLPDAQLVVAPGGHGLPLENPAAGRRRARRAIAPVVSSARRPASERIHPEPAGGGQRDLPVPRRQRILEILEQRRASPGHRAGPDRGRRARRRRARAAATPSGPSSVDAT